MKQLVYDIEVLHEPAKPLKFLEESGYSKEEGLAIVAELEAVLKEMPDLPAITAPELGINARVISIRFNDSIKTFINPIITKKANKVIAPETWRGLPGKEILTSRPTELTVLYYTGEFKYEENKLLDAAARLFDQQAQILDGVLPSDVGMVSDIELDGSLVNASEEEMAQLVEMYKSFVKIKAESLKTAIEQDPELARQYREMNFGEKVISGEAAVVSDVIEKQVHNRKIVTNLAAAKATNTAQKANFNAYVGKVSKKRK